MSIEEEASFAAMLVASALERAAGTFDIEGLAAAHDELSSSAHRDVSSPVWEVAVALARLTVDLYMSGELDANVEGCLLEAIRVFGNAIDDRRSRPWS